MKIANLFAKGLVITTIASMLALGAGVAGVSASDGRHDRNASGSEHERGSEHGHDDDDHDDHGRGHESHGQGWGFGHGTDDDNCDDSSDDDSAPDTTVSTSGPTSEPTIEAPAIVFEVPAVAAPTDFQVTNPEVAGDPTTNPSLAGHWLVSDRRPSS
jgi:hypothetical protein